MAREKNVKVFNRDVANNDGYIYAVTNKLSCNMSNSRMTQAIHNLLDLKGKRVIDIGCGDGTYTLELVSMGAASVVGIDAAEEAIGVARKKATGIDDISFEPCDIYKLGAISSHYDVAIVRGILHHLYQPREAIAEICQVADDVIIVEPNGNNPALKLIEKFSSYHRQHEERSYFPQSLDKWFQECGGVVKGRLYVGLVPMFCPDWVARILKRLEPVIENTPIIREICCGQYIQHISMHKKV